MTYEQLFADHDGKVSDKWLLYLHEYENICLEYRDRPIRVLEIGVQNGGSLEILGKYFPHAEVIVGCDVNPACAQLVYEDRRVAVIVGDANSDVIEQAILQKAARFDLIIDDGSHRSSDIICTFARYFPHLSDGGVFVAEDLHCSYWKEFEGGLLHSFSSIEFFKHLVDVLNYDHWDIDRARSFVLDGFLKTYGARIDDEVLKRIHSVHFANSMCVVRKMAPSGNALGRRVVAGAKETVVRGVLERRASQQIVPNQRFSGGWRDIPLHSSLRHYYAFRNSVFLFLRSDHPLRWKLADSYRLIGMFFVFALLLSDRFAHVKMMLLGTWDGLRGRMGRYDLIHTQARN